MCLLTSFPVLSPQDNLWDNFTFSLVYSSHFLLFFLGSSWRIVTQVSKKFNFCSGVIEFDGTAGLGREYLSCRLSLGRLGLSFCIFLYFALRAWLIGGNLKRTFPRHKVKVEFKCHLHFKWNLYFQQAIDVGCKRLSVKTHPEQFPS